MCYVIKQLLPHTYNSAPQCSLAPRLGNRFISPVQELGVSPQPGTGTRLLCGGCTRKGPPQSCPSAPRRPAQRAKDKHCPVLVPVLSAFALMLTRRVSALGQRPEPGWDLPSSVLKFSASCFRGAGCWRLLSLHPLNMA